MKFYYSAGACSLAVRIVINALDLECEFEAVNLKTHRTESGQDFYTISPKGAVGTLVLANGKILTENCVIMQYLCENHSASQNLLPISGIERYRVLEWLSFIATELHQGCAPLNAAIAEESKEKIFRPKLIKKLTFIEKILAQQSYLCFDHPCLADYYLYVVLRWLPGLGINRSEFNSIEKYFHHIQNLPAVIKSLQQEHL